jgi:hypothetical protein
MIIKVKDMRMDIDKISFLEYNPKGGKDQKGAALLVIDGINLSIPDPTAKQIARAFDWHYQDSMYNATKGEVNTWTNKWKKGGK